MLVKTFRFRDILTVVHFLLVLANTVGSLKPIVNSCIINMKIWSELFAHIDGFTFNRIEAGISRVSLDMDFISD